MTLLWLSTHWIRQMAQRGLMDETEQPHSNLEFGWGLFSYERVFSLRNHKSNEYLNSTSHVQVTNIIMLMESSNEKRASKTNARADDSRRN